MISDMYANRISLRSVALALSALAVLGKTPMQKRTFNYPPRKNPKEHEPLLTSALDRSEINKNLPESFDWCEKGFCGPSWNQHIPQYCGACYLHGSLSAYQDRALINGVAISLSRQSYLNCGPGRNSSNGCNGGEPGSVFQYMHDFGIPDDSCLPYNATDNTKFGNEESKCPPEGECLNCMYVEGAVPPRTECWPVTKFTKYRAKRWGSIKGEHAMMKEIFKYGPITCGIACPVGFAYSYRTGIFEDKTNERDIDHDIEVVGWGEENGVKYWNIRNSWGSYWGINGFARIVRGKDNLAIESDCTWVQPDLSEAKLVTGIHPRYGGSHFGLVDMKVKSSGRVSEETIMGSPNYLKGYEMTEETPAGSSQFSLDLSSAVLILALVIAMAAVMLHLKKRSVCSVHSSSSEEYTVVP